ncbi:MAG: hypothetical protein ABEJ82_00365 [Haloplanus sp.]
MLAPHAASAGFVEPGAAHLWLSPPDSSSWGSLVLTAGVVGRLLAAETTAVCLAVLVAVEVVLEAGRGCRHWLAA